jgi:tetratricopeptide (TPR) repeat protein
VPHVGSEVPTWETGLSGVVHALARDYYVRMTREHRPRRKHRSPNKTPGDKQVCSDGAKTTRRFAWLVFGLALIVRLAYLYESSDNPTFTTPIMDSADYDSLARSLVDGSKPSTSLFWQSVFYPLFLFAAYGLTGSSIVAAKLIQAVIGAATCVLAYRLGRIVFDLRTGILAGIITALCGPLVFFEGELLATGWAAFWTVALVLLLLRCARCTGEAARQPNRRQDGSSVSKVTYPLLGLGFCGALAVITRPTFLPVFLAGCLWLGLTLRRRDDAARRIVRPALLVLAGFLLVALPVATMNWIRTDHFGMMPASGGINFYIGNNPHAEETISYRPGREWDELTNMPEQYGVVGGPWAHQRFFYRQAWEYVRDEPADFLRGLARKGVEFISAREMPRSVDLYVFREWSHILSGLVWKAGRFGFPFGVLLPLALIACVHHRRSIPGPVWLMTLLYPLSTILVFTAARYRAPLLPVVSVLAAAGALALVTATRSRDPRRLAVYLALAVAGVAIACVPGPFRPEQINYKAELHRLLGHRFFAEGKTDRAIQAYRESLRFAPNDADVNGKLAEALLIKGDPGGAIVHYTASLNSRPGSALNRARLGLAFHEDGQLERAVTEYRKALAMDPSLARVHSNLGVVLQKSGDLDGAIEAYRQAARLSPGDAIVSYNLGAALARRGDLDAAVKALRRSLDIDPNNADVRYELAAVLNRQGIRDEAAAEAAKALRINPQHDRAQALLDALGVDRPKD